jgi:1,4-dihydroxy-2-naphthoate octaprenyltransferase
VLAAGILASLVALALGVPLVVAGGWPIVIIGLVSLAFAYGYTGGPFPLAYLGLGDLFVILFFGLVAVGGMFYLHTSTWNGNAALAGLQIGCLAAVILAVNNLRDVDSDRRSGRRTLPVRFGARFGRREIAFMSLLPFGLNGWWLALSWPAAVLPLLSLPLAVSLIRGVYREAPSPIYNRFLALAAAFELAFGFLLGLGMML